LWFWTGGISLPSLDLPPHTLPQGKSPLWIRCERGLEILALFYTIPGLISKVKSDGGWENDELQFGAILRYNWGIMNNTSLKNTKKRKKQKSWLRIAKKDLYNITDFA
jgi:hypothetical protein